MPHQGDKYSVLILSSCCLVHPTQTQVTFSFPIKGSCSVRQTDRPLAPYDMPPIDSHRHVFMAAPPTYENSSVNGDTVVVDPSTSAASTSSLPGGHSGHAAEGAPPALLNLVPFPGEVSFQRGYLGHTASTVQGSLQIKFTSSDPDDYRNHVDRVTVEFAGIERVRSDDCDDVSIDKDKDKDNNGKQASTTPGNSNSKKSIANQHAQAPLDLIRETKVLWERCPSSSSTSSSSATQPHSGASASSHSSGRSASGAPPGNLDFTFQLTDDLPHCCHVGCGLIEYTLTANIHNSRTNKTLSVVTPIHLSRSSPPPSSTSSTGQPSTDPEIYTSKHPTDISVFFPHGTSNFSRSEAIELRVRIPPPDAALVQEKGLKLRSISAELVRIIALRDGDEQQDPDVIQLLDSPALRTIISKSGKAAAFSSSRSVFLHIWLQPVDPESCESISQNTIFNEIKFAIRVTASFRGKQGDRQDITFLDRPVTIIPDYPPSSARELQMPSTAPAAVTTAFASGPYVPRGTSAASSSRPPIDPALLRAFEEETEYDGYEQMSEEASAETAPPSIDADEPPPSIEDESSSDGHEVLPSSSTPQPMSTTGAVPASPFGTSDLADEAPPYSSATENLPANAVDVAHATAQRPPSHHDHHHDDSPVPPPPYESERHGHSSEHQQQPGLEDPAAMREIRQAVHDFLRV